MDEKFNNKGTKKGNFSKNVIIPKHFEDLVFDGVGFASKFLSSLMPWHKAMVIRSR